MAKSSFWEEAMLRRISLGAAILAAVALPATEALAWRAYGGGYRGGYRGAYYHGGYGYRGGYYRGYPGYGVGAAAAGAALGAAAVGAAAAGAAAGASNSCYVWNGVNWVWTC
jgi:hypothetical protein